MDVRTLSRYEGEPARENRVSVVQRGWAVAHLRHRRGILCPRLV